LELWDLLLLFSGPATRQQLREKVLDLLQEELD
jgi:hypothetical protein